MTHTQLHIEVLGAPRMSTAGKPLSGFVSVKAQALFIYLALHPGHHQRSFLVNLLWSEVSESDGKTSLRQVLSNLKKIAGDYIEIQRHTAAWHGKTPQLDLEHIAKTTDWDTLKPLLRGRFLDGFVLKGAPQFEAWLTQTREETRRDIISHLDRFLANSTKPSRRQEILEQLIQHDPWREAAWLEKMRLEALSGREMAAIKTAGRLRELAKAENLPLSPAIDQLERRVRARQAQPALHNMPLDRTPLVGRDHDLAQLKATFAQRETRLATLFGLGGSGKTRLAQSFGRTAPELFMEGATWVPLDGISTFSGVYSAIASATNQPPSAQYGTEEGLISWLSNKEQLLVLDNFEQLAHDSPKLGRLLDKLPQLHLLVTSRKLLNLYDERIFEVDGLPFPTQNDKAPLDFPAVNLFTRIAERIQPSFRIDKASAEVQVICQVVHGLPLALELAAATLRQKTAVELATRIQEEVHLLQTNFHNVPERHRSMRAVFAYSWSLLNQTEQTVLSRLALFVGGFTAEAAHIVGDSNQRVLQALVDQALVQIDENGRYALHPLLRQFATEKLDQLMAQSEPERETYGRYATYYANVVTTLDQQLAGETTKKALAHFDAEINNVRHMWQILCDTEQISQLKQVIEGVCNYFYLRGLMTEGHDLLKGLQALLHGRPHPDEIRFYWYVRSRYALFLVHLCRYLDGLTEGRTVLQNFPHPKIIDAHTIAIVHYVLGQSLIFTGEAEQGKEHLEEGLNWVKTAQIPGLEAYYLNRLSYVAINGGEVEVAQKYCRQAISITQKVGHRNKEADCYLNYGNTFWQLGDYQQAREQYEKCLALVQELGMKYTEVTALNNMGLVCSEMGEHQAGIRYVEMAIDQSRDVGDRWGEGNGVYNLLNLKLEMGDWQNIEALLTQALMICQEISDRQGEGLLHIIWGKWLMWIGQYEPIQSASGQGSADF